MPARPRGRRSQWLRDQESRDLHAIALHLRNLFWEGRSSERQDWLFDNVVAELEWRHDHTRPVYLRCECELCHHPFPDDVGLP